MTESKPLDPGSPPPSGKSTPTAPADPRAINREQRTRDVDELSAQLRALEGVDTDIAELLANNWQRFAGLVLMILLGVWLYSGYRSTKQQRLALAAERFQSVQGVFEQLGAAKDPKTDADKDPAAVDPANPPTPEPAAKAQDAPPAKKPEETDALKSFRQEAELLVSTEGGTAYGKLAELYEAAQMIRAGETAGAEKMLAKFNAAGVAKQPVPAGAKPDPDRFIAELAALMHVRLQIAKDAVQNLPPVREYLAELAVNARFVNLEALLLLGRLADSDQLKAQVRTLGEKVVAARPELREMIETELSSVGVSIS